MSTLKERFEELCKHISASTRVQVYGQDAILAFFQQELNALAEEVVEGHVGDLRGATPDTNTARAAALIRSRANEL